LPVASLGQCNANGTHTTAMGGGAMGGGIGMGCSAVGSLSPQAQMQRHVAGPVAPTGHMVAVPAVPLISSSMGSLPSAQVVPVNGPLGAGAVGLPPPFQHGTFQHGGSYLQHQQPMANFVSYSTRYPARHRTAFAPPPCHARRWRSRDAADGTAADGTAAGRIDDCAAGANSTTADGVADGLAAAAAAAHAAAAAAAAATHTPAATSARRPNFDTGPCGGPGSGLTALAWVRLAWGIVQRRFLLAGRASICYAIRSIR